MKKVVIICGMIMLLGSMAIAQEPATGLTGKGVKFGLNSSEFTGDFAEGLDSKTGLGVGGFVTFALSPDLAIQPEMLYMSKGAQIEESMGGYSLGLKFKVSYLEIPVLFKYSFPTQGSVKPNLFAGPALALLTSSTFAFEASTPLLSGSVDFDAKDATKSVDFGLVFGGGLGFQSGKTTITLEFRYTMGMTKIADFQGWNDFATDFAAYLSDIDPDLTFSPADMLLEDPDLKNNNMSFLVGISF